MRWLIILVTALSIFSCNTDNPSAGAKKDSSYLVEPKIKEKDSSSATTVSSAKVWEGCYWKVVQKDTFALHLQQSKGTVSGRLTFNNYQKDKSTGTVHGNIDGDIIRLWYTFSSEGMNSVMEIYFKKQDDGLVRGLGNVAVKGDTSYFENAGEVRYRTDQVFTRVSCSQVPSRYL